MPDSIIKKVEKLADRIEKGISFKNKQKKSFDQENEECNNDQVESEQNALSYLDLAAEFPRIELLHDQPIHALEEDESSKAKLQA